MKHLKPLLLLIILFSTSYTVFGQETEIEVPVKEQLFTDKDKDFLQLWYYDQVLTMQLNEQGRDDYTALLEYYTFKMTRLGLTKYQYTSAEQKTRFDALVAKLDAEMKDYLSSENYKIHKESFKKIQALVYEKKNWEK